MSLLSALLDSKLEDAKLITHVQSRTISYSSCTLTKTLIWGVEVRGLAREQGWDVVHMNHIPLSSGSTNQLKTKMAL